MRCASCPPTRPHTRTHIHSLRAAPLIWVLTCLHEITLHEMKLTRKTCCASAHLRPTSSASSAPGKHSCQRSQASWSPLPSRLLNRLDRRGWSTSGGSRRPLSNRGTSPARVEPTATRVLPKLVSRKSLSECCECPECGKVCQEVLGLSFLHFGLV